MTDRHDAVRSRALYGALVALGAGALVVHARSFDAVCDDAFISLRYAANLVHHGAPVYNPGERVEGYTSPSWMLLEATLLAAGVESRSALTALGALGAVALVVAVWRLWCRIAPDDGVAGLLVVALVAGSTPVAAWSSSGLETPLFGALVAFALGEFCTCFASPTGARALVAGAIVALATLTRPEGVLLGVVFLPWLLEQRRTRRAVLPFLLAVATPLAAFLLFRWAYYGTLLPNTYAAKTAAPTPQRLAVGLKYAWFTAKEMGLGVSILLVAGMSIPHPRAEVRLVRRMVAIYGLAVIAEGGDFLDLFRLFVPVLPLLYVLVVATSLEVAARAGTSRRGWALGVALAAPPWIVSEVSLRGRALRADDPARQALWIEPLAWTRAHALIWADQGRFMHDLARSGDTMASGAAGALPYYAELPNLDLLGLTDAETAHHGSLVGSRPGHQRFATLDYVMSRRPTYLMFDRCLVPVTWHHWDHAGYVCVGTRRPTLKGGQLDLVFFAEHARAIELEREGAVRLREP